MTTFRVAALLSVLALAACAGMRDQGQEAELFEQGRTEAGAGTFDGGTYENDDGLYDRQDATAPEW